MRRSCGSSPTGVVEVLVEPRPWRPRRDSRRRAKLVTEHRQRIGAFGQHAKTSLWPRALPSEGFVAAGNIGERRLVTWQRQAL
jgi:hypothetical protein